MLKRLNVKTTEKGISLYLGLMVMTILLAIGLGISTIIVSQMRMIREMGDSVIALYAADTGIEMALDDDTPDLIYSGYLDLNNNGTQDGEDSSYEVGVFCCVEGAAECAFDVGECPGLSQDSNCNASYFCYKSVGTYKRIKRAIEVTR